MTHLQSNGRDESAQTLEMVRMVQCRSSGKCLEVLLRFLFWMAIVQAAKRGQVRTNIWTQHVECRSTDFLESHLNGSSAETRAAKSTGEQLLDETIEQERNGFKTALAPGKPKVFVLESLPSYSKDILEQCPNRWYGNLGYGPQLHFRWTQESLSEDFVLHATYQFALDVILYNKFLRYSGRVFTISEADYVFVPFLYWPIESLQFHPECNRTRQHILGAKDANLAPTRTTIQSVILPDFLMRVERHLQFLKAKEKLVLLSLSHVPRAYVDSLFSPAFKTLLERTIPLGIEDEEQHFKKVLMVPYPTMFHARGEIVGKSSITERTIFVVYASKRLGLPEWQSGKVFSLRTEILRWLVRSEGISKVIFTHKNFTLSGCYEAMSKSLFCIQPPGDTPTRRGFYDSLLLGCIPVVFSKRAYNMFNWSSEGMAVHVPQEVPPSALIGFLLNITAGEIVRIQHTLHQVQASMQYSLVQDEQHDAFGTLLRTLS